MEAHGQNSAVCPGCQSISRSRHTRYWRSLQDLPVQGTQVMLRYQVNPPKLQHYQGKWVYLYRAVDSTGATIDFLLSAKRDAPAAERFLAKALGGTNHPAPRVINTDEHAGYPPAIVRLKAEGVLEENCQHRPVQCHNNVLEQDHRAIKRRINARQHFHMIR